MKVADYISHYLAIKGVPHVFGVSGANIEDLFDSILKNKKTEVILAKSEYSASTMCLGSYLTTKKTSVVLTTSGPGILNTIPILAEAYTSKIPMILISGIVPLSMEGVGAFQDTSGKGESFNILKMLEHCSCYQKKIENENDIQKSLYEAFEYSERHKRPAVILIPKDLFKKEVLEMDLDLNSEDAKNDSIPLYLEEISESFINNMASPLIVLGEELIHLDNLSKVLSFIEKSGGGVALTANSKSLYDNNSPRYLGLIGVMGHDKVNDYLKQTSHVIFIGVSFTHLNLYGLLPHLHSKEILVLNTRSSLNPFTTPNVKFFELCGDIENIVSTLSSKITEFKAPTLMREELNEDPYSYELKNIITEIQTIMNNDSNVFIDAGNTGAFVIHHLKLKGTGTCHVSLGMGGMGNSIGAGIGAAIANRKKTYVFLGDGAFLMYGLEIHTAHEHNLPITFFIFNNNSHGMCATRENVFLTGETGINNFKPCYFADGFNKIFPEVISHEVNNMYELKLSLNDVENRLSTNVISINITNKENPPFRTFNKN